MRVTCPKCRNTDLCAIFPEIIDHEGTRIPERLLCKWCGYYYSEYGELQCEPHENGVWMARNEAEGVRPTPKELFEEEQCAS